MARLAHVHENAASGVRFDCSNSECKMPFRCNAPKPKKSRVINPRIATHEEQNARLLDAGYQNWDDRGDS